MNFEPFLRTDIVPRSSELAIYRGSYTAVTKERVDTETILNTVNLDIGSIFRIIIQILLVKEGWL